MITEKVLVESPQYFRHFRCKCGDCRTVCCRGWRITLAEHEYSRMKGLSCSEELRRALDEAFVPFENPTKERYAYIKPSAEGGGCPIMDERGWCRLHSECGEGVQPSVCRLFPRSIKPGEITEAVCSGACERVIEMLMESEEPLRFVQTELETTSLPPDAGMDEEQRERRRRCMAIWQDRAISHAERLRRIAGYLGVPHGADAAQTDGHGRLLLEHLGLPSSSLHALAENILAREDTYAESTAYRRLPHMDAYLENILANHMYFARFPYVGEGISPAEAWDGLYGVYALLRTVALYAVSAAGDAEIGFVDGMAAALRCAEHTDFYHNAHIVLRGRRK